MALSQVSMSRNTVLGALVAVVALVSLSLFTVDETQTAIRFQLGEIVEANYPPGLHWKWPLINNVRKFDRRLQTLDTEPVLNKIPEAIRVKSLFLCNRAILKSCC